MLSHYLDLALRSLRRNPVLTLLMVLTTAIGVGAAMTTLSVYRMLSADPIPEKSARLFRVHVGATQALTEPMANADAVLTPHDAAQLLHEARGLRQSIVFSGDIALTTATTTHRPVDGAFVAATRDFFPMFLVPMRYGMSWSAQDDASHARVAVLSHELNAALFSGTDSTGKLLYLGRDQPPLRVIGVAAHWRPVPKFHRTSAMFSTTPEVFLPQSTARDLGLTGNGLTICPPNIRNMQQCAWQHYWVELDPGGVDAYRHYLRSYLQRQQASGRLAGRHDPQLVSLMDWLRQQGLIPADFYLQLWLAFGFLAACQINMAGLLLAKFAQRRNEIGIRRALGARRGHIFGQFLGEAGLIGLLGGVAGIGMTALGLWGVRHQPVSYSATAGLDAAMVCISLGVAVVVSLLSGLLPAWHAMHVAPAIQIKSP